MSIAIDNGITKLFACTRCNSRHPFEMLSRKHQLCPNCRDSFRVIKCEFCCSEFNIEVSDIKSSSICKKCEQLQGQHGKPKNCSCCNLQAAFIGSRCQRCAISEKKYGTPHICDNCSHKCAFDRPNEESKAKVGGKMLCWLCTMNYKRDQAKSKHSHHHNSRNKISREHNHHNHHSHSKIDKTSNGHHKTSNQSLISASGSSLTNHNLVSQNNSSSLAYQRQSHHHSSSHQVDSAPSPKRSRIDRTSSNGLSSLTETRLINQANSESTAIVTQLKEQITALNKKLLIKEKELQTKDQQIADLRSTQTREQREMREKIVTLQRQHNDRTSELQSKLIALQKQLAAQTKAKSNNTSSSAYIEPPMVI